MLKEPLEFIQARKLVLSKITPLTQTEMLPLHQCLHRVLAQSIINPIAIPNFSQSMMDGYALQKSSINSKPIYVSNRIMAGDTQVSPLVEGTAVRIMTGGMIPAGADIVIPQELVETVADSNHIKIIAHKITTCFIRKMGSAIAIKSTLYQSGTKLFAVDLAQIANTGIAELEVYKNIKVAVITTGDELQPVGTMPLLPGQIFNSNSYLLDSLILEHNFELINLGNVQDDLVATKHALLESSEIADVIISTGGVSVGEKDYVKSALLEIGELEVFSVNMKPGKPLAFGRVNNKIPFIGLPGNPVSAFVVMQLFGLPLLHKLSGQQINDNLEWQFLPCNTDYSPGKRTEFVRAKLTDNMMVDIFPNQDSGNFSSVVWADGLAVIPPNQRIKKHAQIAYLPFANIMQ